MLWLSAPKPCLAEESYIKDFWYNYSNVWSDEEKPAPCSGVYQNKCYLLGAYGQTSWVSMNLLNFDPKTIFTLASEKPLCDQIDSMGIEVDPIPYDKVIPLGGALHCTTLDIYREGGREDYFPNQVAGY